MWFLLENKVPTWDNIQKRHLEGPNSNSPCKYKVETMVHLSMECPYIKCVWAGHKGKLGFA